MSAAQIKSRDRVKDLAEVYTHEREVNAMLDLVPEMFPSEDAPGNTDRLFLEPACGNGNFLVEIVRRKLAFVTTRRYGRGERYEHRVLRCLASTYGIDICDENIEEARERILDVLVQHVGGLSEGLLAAATTVLETNVVCADALADAAQIELIEYRPEPGGCFLRVWSTPLVPGDGVQTLFAPAPRMDEVPIHYTELACQIEPTSVGSIGRKAA